MERFYEVWDWSKRISGITFATSLVLYFIRCVVTWHIVTLAQWEKWFNGLMSYIF